MSEPRANILRHGLLAAALYNITGGLLLLFAAAPLADLTGLDPQTNLVLRLFVAGTAVTFGLGYLQAWRSPAGHRQMVRYGAGLKFWAFAISLYCLLFAEISQLMFWGFGVGNLVLGLGFVAWLRRTTN